MINKALKISRNIVVGFFILVFAMGFFSKSVINLFLPKVQVISAVEMPVERTLVLEGKVEPRSTVKIRLGREVTVDEYYVEPGSAVNIGDPLFRVNQGYINEDNTGNEVLELRLEGEMQRLEDFKNEDLRSDEINIEILDERLEMRRAELLKYEELYKAGAIAEAELGILKEKIIEQEMSLEKNRLELEQKKRDMVASAKEAEIRVKELKAQIAGNMIQQQLYSKTDEEGICRSRVKGIVVKTNTSGIILPKEDNLVEIAEVKDGKQLLFTASAAEIEYDFIKNAGEVEVRAGSSNKPSSVRIISVSRIVQNRMIDIKGEFSGVEADDLRIGQDLRGEVVRRYTRRGFLSVPKASIIAPDGFAEGKGGTVYLLEEQDGVLGKEYEANQAEVKMLAVGDDYVIVSGLESYEKPRVIVNLSYKISDRVRVFLWE